MLAVFLLADIPLLYFVVAQVALDIILILLLLLLFGGEIRLRR